MRTSIIHRRLKRPFALHAVRQHTDAPRSPRALIAALVLPLASGCSTLLVGASASAFERASWWRPDDAIMAALTALGALIAAWYALTALGIVVTAIARHDLGVRRWGAPLLRTLSTGAGSVGLALGTPAIALAEPDLAWDPGAIYVEEQPHDDPPDLAWDPSSATMANDDSPDDEEEHERGFASDESERPDTEEPADLTDVDRASETAGNTLTETPSPLPHDETPAPATTNDAIAVEPTGPTDLHTDRIPERTPERRSAVPIDPAIHVVSAGESLWSIAASEHPNATNGWILERVGEYVAANPSVQPNPDLIFPGQRLAIPEEAP